MGLPPARCDETLTMKPLTVILLALAAARVANAEYPVTRPSRATPAAADSSYTIYPDKLKQVIKGIGFEIQSDSITSGNKGLPDAFTSVPHDLIPSERQRFCNEMLKGFRYCRLAGGLYWRGLDREQKHLQPRWPEQLTELRDMIKTAGIEGVSLEYWSPAPYWKANRKYTGKDGTESVLRCFGKNFADDPDYHGDVARFLADFAAACRRDLQTLEDNGIPIAMWGLQNEPLAETPYSCCVYTPATYARTFLAVAPAIRAFDPHIAIIADSWDLRFIQPVLKDPDQTRLVDALAIHHIGSDSKMVTAGLANPAKPVFQNEYEYLRGPTSPDRCLNTVQHIMNWFQLGRAPIWYWIHALKPVMNQEASGYSLGFWRPIDDADPKDDAKYGGLKPGCWKWNPHNWHAVGSFVKHMPWDCQAVEVHEAAADSDLRILAFKKPNGKLTIVLSNRSFSSQTFKVATGLEGATFKGCRYTPDEAGNNCQGVDIGILQGPAISPRLGDLSWEFWEQQ